VPPPKTIRELESLVKQDPANSGHFQHLGDAWLKAGDKQKAVDAYFRAVLLHERDGFLIKAIAQLKQCAKLAPGRSDIAARLADLHHALGLEGEALALLRLALTLAHRELDLDACLRLAQTLVEREPADPSHRLYFAHALLWNSQEVQAREQLLEGARLLEASQPALAARLRALDLTSTGVAVLRSLRLELSELDAAARTLEYLDFNQPN
jgi:tetratricopeptide (TPR) repeat protein